MNHPARIYTMEVSHCIYCPHASHDKIWCLRPGDTYHQPTPSLGIPSWCQLPVVGRRGNYESEGQGYGDVMEAGR